MRNKIPPPPRRIEGEMREFYKRRTMPSFAFWSIAFPGIIGLIIIAILQQTIIRGEVPVITTLIWAFSGFIVLVLLVGIGLIVFNKIRYKKLLTYGRVINAKVGEITESWNIRMNGWPRRTINLTIEGRATKANTFNNSFVQACMGKTVELIYHPDMPKLIVPTVMLNAKRKWTQERLINR